MPSFGWTTTDIPTSIPPFTGEYTPTPLPSVNSTFYPSPAQPGIVPGCLSYYQAQDGETCADLVDGYYLTREAFFAMNPADIIMSCVMHAFEGEATCDAILKKAQENLDSMVKDNLKQILKALDGKMAKDGIVIYSGYARFFNEENEACANDQYWAPFYWFRGAFDLKDPLPLTIERRKKFNFLTTALNNAIRDVVHDVADEVKYKIGYSNWDLWAIEGVKGQMCDPSSSGAYPDPKQPDLIFFKPDSRKSVWRGPFKRSLIENETTIPTEAVSLDSSVPDYRDPQRLADLPQPAVKAITWRRWTRIIMPAIEIDPNDSRRCPRSLISAHTSPMVL